MIYTPPISDYKPFYIQFGSNAAIDLIGSPYYVIIKSPDYPPYKVKEPYKNQWKDEHGDEEYIGNNGLYVEAFTLKFECAMFAIRDSGQSEATLISSISGRLRSFREALRSGGLFKIYDSYTGFGFQNVRLANFPTPSSDDYRVDKFHASLIFTLELKVNDPVTAMTYSNGSIVSA